MKTNNIKLVCGSAALVLFGALMVQGCSSSDDSSGGTAGASSGGKGGTSSGTAGKGGATGTAGATTGTAGKGGATGTAGTGAGGTSAAAGDTGMTEGGSDNGGAGAPSGEAGAAGAATGGDHPTAKECSDFCALDATTCTGTDAAYTSTEVCETTCAGFALGDVSDPTFMTPTTGDNFGCRAYHLENAVKSGQGANASAANVTLHCGHTAKVSSACFNP